MRRSWTSVGWLVSVLMWLGVEGVATAEDAQTQSVKSMVSKAVRATNPGGVIASLSDLTSDARGVPGAYNRNLALLGALAVDDIYRGAGNNDAESLMADGFVKAAVNSRIAYGSAKDATGEALEALTLEKRVGDKRFIAIVFKGTKELADWGMNLMATPVPFPFFRGWITAYTSCSAELQKLVMQLEKQFAVYRALGFNWTLLSPESSARVHEGFRTMAWDYAMCEGDIRFSDNKSLYDLIKEAKTNPNIRFLVFGHSMGGAVATLYSCELAERGVRPACYTYAAAAAGDAALNQQFSSKMDYHNFVHPKDPILFVESHPNLKHMSPQYYYTMGMPIYSATYTPQAFSLDHEFALYHLGWLYVLHAGYDLLQSKGVDVSFIARREEFALLMRYLSGAGSQ
jgi:hypothetical protein